MMIMVMLLISFLPAVNKNGIRELSSIKLKNQSNRIYYEDIH